MNWRLIAQPIVPHLSDLPPERTKAGPLDPASASMRRQARPSQRSLPKRAERSAPADKLKAMNTSEVDPLIEGFAQMLQEHGDEAVQQLVTSAYPEVFAKSAPADDPTDPSDLTDLEERVGVLEEIVSKLADQADLGAGLAKSGNGNGRLSEQDRKAVAEMTRGF